MAFKSNAKLYNASREKVWQALEQTCSSLKWTTTSSKLDQGILEVKSGITLLCPLGILLSIRLMPVDLHNTQVNVEAKSRGQLVDYGQSGREIKRLFEALDKMMVSVNEAPKQTADGIPCSKCGCQLELGAKFCRKCGEPVTILATTSEAEVAASQNLRCKCGEELDSNMRFCPRCGEPTV